MQPCVVKGKTYGSFKSHAKCSSIVLAELNGQLHPTRVNFFSKVVASVDDNSVSHFDTCFIELV